MSPNSQSCKLRVPGACRAPPRMRAGAVCCLAVSMATKSVGWWSPSEKMKLKSLLLRYYPPGTGQAPSAFTWRSAPGGSGAEEKCWGPGGGVHMILPRYRTAGSFTSSVFSFIRNLCTVIHSGHTSLHSHHWCLKVPISTNPRQHLLSVDILMIVFRDNVR